MWRKGAASSTPRNEKNIEFAEMIQKILTQHCRDVEDAVPYE